MKSMPIASQGALGTGRGLKSIWLLIIRLTPLTGHASVTKLLDIGNKSLPPDVVAE